MVAWLQSKLKPIESSYWLLFKFYYGNKSVIPIGNKVYINQRKKEGGIMILIKSDTYTEQVIFRWKWHLLSVAKNHINSWKGIRQFGCITEARIGWIVRTNKKNEFLILFLQQTSAGTLVLYLLAPEKQMSL